MRESLDRIKTLVATAETEDRDLTPDEVTEKDALVARMTALDKKRQRGRHLRLAAARRAGPPGARADGRGAGQREPDRQPAGRLAAAAPRASLGAQFTEHEVYQRSIHAAQRGGQWQSPTFEIHAAGVTLSPAAPIPPGTEAPLAFPFPPEWSVAGRFAQGTTSGGLVPYLRETVWTNAAAVVAMGAAKPQSTKTFELVQQPLVKIAHYIDCPDELLDDVEGLRSFIDAQMAGGVLEKLETEIIAGPGGAGQIQGILTLPGIAPPIAWTTGPYITPIIQQYAAVYELSRLRPDTVVMSPSTWAVVVTQTSTAGGFLLGPGIVVGARRRSIWGMDLIQSPSVTDGTAIVGAFKRAASSSARAASRCRRPIPMRANFVSNITSIRAELRVALAYYRPAAFGLVTGLVVA